MTGAWRSTRAAWLLALLAVAAFEAAYEYEAAAGLIVVYLACLFLLARVKTPRLAFYLGLAIGTATAGLQLTFFYGLFGPMAIGLWAILGLWIALFLLLSRIVVERWPRWGAAWLPILWLGLEYFRCELYYLRFAWLTPGLALSGPRAVGMAAAGVYGFSFCVLSLLAILALTRRRTTPAVAACFAPVLFLAAVPAATTPSPGPYVAGIQLEGPTVDNVIEELDRARRDIPEAELFVLSEYCFDAPIPPAVCDWCARHGKYLIAGGKKPIAGSAFIDTAFVISPTGATIFEQGKSVPIQFFNDGLPAREQKLWDSPWGKIGIAICYDLSYSRVIDRLVEMGAQGLVIPTMDAEDWGEHEHRLHAHVAPVRAREYGIPIFRVASSGISQLVDAQGRELATAPFPGQGERLHGRMLLGTAGQKPIDRYLALPAVIAVGTLLMYLAICNLRGRFRPRSS